MSKDLNLCQFIGRLGQDPEIRHLPNGDPVVNFSIAVGDDYKDKSGQKVEQTEWVRATAFRGLAEVIGKYLTKGSRVYLSGKQKTRKWTDKEGVDRYTTELIVDNMQMLDTKTEGSHNTKTEQKSQNGTNESQGGGGGFSDIDDDIPFAPLGREHFV